MSVDTWPSNIMVDLYFQICTNPVVVFHDLKSTDLFSFEQHVINDRNKGQNKK